MSHMPLSTQPSKLLRKGSVRMNAPRPCVPATTRLRVASMDISNTGTFGSPALNRNQLPPLVRLLYIPLSVPSHRRFVAPGSTAMVFAGTLFSSASEPVGFQETPPFVVLHTWIPGPNP